VYCSEGARETVMNSVSVTVVVDGLFISTVVVPEHVAAAVVF
jgi:hypothetical protein